MARKVSIVLLLILSVSTLVHSLGRDGKPLTLTRISTQFAYPVGCGFHEPSGSLITTAHYPSGVPEVFRRVDALGNQYPFSTISGLTDEVKLGTVRSGNPIGFVTGDLFGGTGNNGHIIRITDNGNTFQNPWCVLPPETGLMRGSLYVDDTGEFGYRLVVVTTTGYIYTVDAQCRDPKQLGPFLNTHLEGLYIVPNNPARYGNLAGRALIGAEQQGKLYAVDKNGNVDTYTTGFGVEDIDLILPGENFFGINFGTGYLLGAPYTAFENNYNDILLTSEDGTQYIMTWENGAPRYDKITYDPNGAVVTQWEHVTFSRGGISEIPPSDWSLCMQISGSGTIVEPAAKAVVLDGALTSVGNYRYEGGMAHLIKPTLVANAVNVFISQDYQYKFGLTIVAGSGAGGAAGRSTIIVKATNLGTSATTKVQDDPINGADTGDVFNWNSGTSSGRFSFTWGAGSTDGVVLDPLDFLLISQRFSIELSIDSAQPLSGVSNWVFHHFDANKNLVSKTIPIGQTLTIDRVSCNCGNGVVDKWEDCDGGDCCNKCVFRPSSFKCGSATPGAACDLDDFCTGNSATCPATFRPSNFLCRDSQGVCDVQDFCSGNAAACPADAKVTAGSVCRASGGDCDVAETCDGTSNGCPADAKQIDGTTCDDRNNCTSVSTCKSGVCSGVDDKCFGVCGDGIIAASEQCDDGENGQPNDCDDCCCNCRFNLNTVTCRASTGLCDPAEKCPGDSGDCPVDVNDRCPVCNKNCSSPNGVCVADGVCQCNPGWNGPDCSTPICDYFTNCSTCSAANGCGWCCEAGRCLDLSVNQTASCPKLLAGVTCDCPTACANGGVCTCGVCVCQPGYTGPDCTLILGCDNKTYTPAEADKAPRVDVCNVCNGNGTTCLGCDGKPFGNVTDRCNVCGGDGSSCYNVCPYTKCGECALAENCVWCDSDKKCVEKTKRSGYTCEKFIEGPEDCKFLGDLTVAEAAGLGAGVIAAVVIGAVAGAALISLAGKKGYDAYMRNKNNMSGAQSNPMYNDGGRTGQNPMYEMK